MDSLENVPQVNLDNLGQIIEEEGILKTCHAGHLASSMSMITGHLFLTEKRLAFRKSPNFLAGLFVFVIKAFKRRFTIHIPLSEISTFKKGTFGRNKNILEVTLKSGESIKFNVDKIDPWLDALKSCQSVS